MAEVRKCFEVHRNENETWAQPKQRESRGAAGMLCEAGPTGRPKRPPKRLPGADWTAAGRRKARRRRTRGDLFVEQ